MPNACHDENENKSFLTQLPKYLQAWSKFLKLEDFYCMFIFTVIAEHSICINYSTLDTLKESNILILYFYNFAGIILSSFSIIQLMFTTLLYPQPL